MASTAAVLNIVVKANTASAVSGLRKVDTVTRRTARSADTASKHASKHGKALKEVGHGAAYALGAGGFGGGLYAVFEILHRSIDKWHEAEQVTKLTGAALKSTGGAANVTAKHVEELSKRIEKKTAIDHLAIQTSENLLLTFPKIRNEAGKNNKIFDRATMAVTNLATALNHGAAPSVDQLHSASIQLGKALQDPIKGATALRRVGVALSASQQKQIKTLVAHGHQMEAQKIILRELSTEFGKAAEKTATPSRRLQTNLNDLTEELGKGVTPWLNKVTTRLNKFIGQMLDGTGAGGKFVGVLKIVGGVFTKILFPLVKFVATTPGIKQVAAALIGVGLAAKAIRFSGAITGVNLLIERLAVLRKSEAATTTIGGLKMHGPAKTGRSILPVAGLATAAVAAGALLGDKLMTSFGDKLAGIRTHGNIFQRAVQRWQQFGKDIGRVGTIIGAKLSAAWAGLPAPARRALLRVQGSFGSMGTEVKRISGRLKAIVPRDLGDMWSTVRRYFSSGTRRVGGLYGDMGSGIKRITGRIASILTSHLGDAWGTVRHLFAAGTSGVGKAFGQMGSGIRRISGRIKSIFSALGRSVSSVAGFISDSVNKVVSALGDLKSKIPDIHIKLPDLPSIPGLRRGGPIDQGKATGDSVPAMLERGEYVLNRKAVSRVGKGQLDALNFDAAPRFARGGEIAPIGVSGTGVAADALRSVSKRMRHAGNRKIHQLEDRMPVQKMVRFGQRIDAKNFPYVYGGGHGSFSGPYDCSGFVSAILHAGGKLGSPMSTDGLKTYGESGDGKYVTIGVRGSTGRNAHTMIKVGSHYFESGGGHGAAEDSGWDGSFPIHRHPKGMQKGGVVGRVISKLRDRGLVLDPRDPNFVGWGLQRGGIVGMARGGLLTGLNRRFPRHGLGNTAGHYQMDSRQVRAVAEAAGFSPARALQFDQIARGESTRYPGIVSGDGGWGLWQITPSAWPANGSDMKHMRALGGLGAMLNPIRNAKMARFMFGESGFRPWHGTAFLRPRQKHVKSVLGSRRTAAEKKKLPPALPVKGLSRRLRNIRGMGVSQAMQTRLRVLSGEVDKFADWADRASQLNLDNPDGTTSLGKVFGGDEAHWLWQELSSLFELRNNLLRAHNRVLELRKKIQKVLLPRARKHLKMLRKHPVLNRDRIKAYRDKIIPALKKRYGDLGTTNTDLLSNLADVQGAGGPMNIIKHLPRVSAHANAAPVGALGGKIFDAQVRLRALGAKTTTTDTTTPERLQSIIDLLREQLQQANLGKAVSEGAFQVFRDMPSFQTAPGQWHTVPGPSHQGVPAMVHGGEMVGRPGDTTVQVYVHPGGGGADVRVNGEWVRAEVRKVLRSEVSRVGRTPARAGT